MTKSNRSEAARKAAATRGATRQAKIARAEKIFDAFNTRLTEAAREHLIEAIRELKSNTSTP